MKNKIKAQNEEIENLKQHLKFLRTELLLEKEKSSNLSSKCKQISEELLKLKVIHKHCPEKEKRSIHNILGNVFTRTQIERLINNKSKMWWTDEDIASALALRSVSKKAYTYLRKVKNIPLPGLSTLAKWTQNFKCIPGIQEEVINIMKAKSKFLNEFSKKTVLSFDEMGIDSRICYDEAEDKAYGPHSNVQVLMARGLFNQWKQPVYYDFDKKVTSQILLQIIETLDNAGFDVVAVVSDMGGGNQGLWKELDVGFGSQKRKKKVKNQTVTQSAKGKLRSSFKHPVTKNNIWVFPDMPHLLKLLRNHFLDEGIKFSDGQTVEKSIVESVIEEQELKLCPKLSTHLTTVKQSARQKVRYAVQLFSHHTATLLKLKYPENKNIYELFETTDKFFDVMNSRFSVDRKKKWHSGFGLDYENQTAIIEKMEKLKSIRIGNHKGLMPFQKGFL
jgi:hypothetical protein